MSVSLTKEVRRLYQPKVFTIKNWINSSLIKGYTHINIDILIVSKDRSIMFNKRYRNKNNPTNVISLEYDNSRNDLNMLFGELILCDDIIVEEAINQHKTIMSHYAHMIMHGMLHIQGYHHEDTKDAKQMEDLEVRMLKKFNIDNPYIIK